MSHFITFLSVKVLIRVKHTTEKPIATQDDVFRVSFSADYIYVITTNYFNSLFINLQLYSPRDDMYVLFFVSAK